VRFNGCAESDCYDGVALERRLRRGCFEKKAEQKNTSPLERVDFRSKKIDADKKNFFLTQFKDAIAHG